MKNKLLLLSFGLLMTTQMIFSQVPSYVPTNGLVGYWPFSGNANDVSGNGNNGTVNGATLTTDRFGNNNSAYSFDGVNDFISTSYSGILGTNSRSVSFWYNSFTNNIDETVFTDYGGANNCGEGFACTLFPSNEPGVDNTGSYIKSNSMTSINNWNFYTVTYNSSDSPFIYNCKLYINGVLQSTSQSSTICDINTINDLNMVFGSSRLFNPVQYFNGKIDDIGIWNRALTQQEITNMYNGVTYSDTCNAVSGSLVNGLVAYYPFCGNANDQSGNGLNGIVNGATLTTDRFGNNNSAYMFQPSSTLQNITTNYQGILGNNNRSISLWFYQNNIDTSTDLKEFCNYGTNTPNNNFSPSILQNRVGIAVNNSTIYYSPNTFGNWHHYVLSYNNLDGNSVQSPKIYLDGVLLSNVYNSFNPPGEINTIAGYNFTIGGISTLNQFDGKIDDIGVWNRALTQQEITQLYNQNQCTTNITVTDTLIINVGQLSYTNPVTYSNNITIYPNPANTQVNISFNNITDLTGGNINIINSLGQQVATTPITATGTNTSMQLTTWGGTGMYFVQILNAQGIVVDVKKIILQ